MPQGKGAGVRVYVIYDRVAEESVAGPDCIKNDGIARRHLKRFQEGVKAGRDDEFWLYCIGDYDNQSMVFTPWMPQRIEAAAAVLDGDE